MNKQENILEMLKQIQIQVKDNQIWPSLNTMLQLLQNTQINEWRKYSQELTDIWQTYLSVSYEKTWMHEIFEHTIIVSLEYSIKNTISSKILEQLLKIDENFSNTDKKYLKNLSAILKRFAFIAVQQTTQQNMLKQSIFLAQHIERMSIKSKLSTQENLSMVHCWNKIGNMEKVYKFTWDSMIGNSPSKVCITATVYNLFLYMLLFPNWRDTCFIIGTGIPIEMENKLLNYGIAGLYQARFSYITDPFGDSIKKFALYVKEKNIPVYGQDHYLEFRYFIKNNNFSVVEEGIGNYKPIKLNYKIILENGKEHIPFGYDEHIKSIYLTGRLPIPEKLKEKAVIFDMKKSWDQKSPSEKNIILNIFSVQDSEFFNLLKQNKDQVLLTQAFQANPVKGSQISRDQMINFYKKILKNYDMSRVIIKVHPRDDIDYKKYFPECSICHDRFPFEFLYIMDMMDKIDTLISINSTAVYGLPKNCKVDLYEEEWKTFLKN